MAWAAVFFASSLAIIIWREIGSGEPAWWPWIHGIVLVGLLIVSVAYEPTRPMWRFSAILVILFFSGFGGGWQFGLVPLVRSSEIWNNWIGTLPAPIDSLAIHLLRLIPSALILFFLLLTGRKRTEFYLAKGQIDADAQPSRLLGMKESEPWTKLGRNVAVVFVVFTVIFLILAYSPTAEQLAGALPLVPAALLIAAMNAFNEEFALRAAPLSELNSCLGKAQALMITSVYFGLGHFYGIPNGIVGVLLSGFLGYFLGKSMLETRGFSWAWFIHFLPDVFIFYFLLALPV